MATRIPLVNTFSKESTTISIATVLGLVLAICAIAPTVQAQDSEEFLEEIVVIAARLRADSVQDVPAAITAIGSETMERQQIENTSDMQLTVPNVSYSKGNFTTSSFQIRGIGSSAVGSTADSGVSVHVNAIPIESHRLYATEFYDVETITIMRGPQGTLFGRNATGGLINVATKKPEREFNASVVAEIGDFNSQRFTGHVNFPMGDKFSARIAGISTARDGYTTNLFTGSDIDGRDMYAVRGTLRFQPSDRTTIDLMASYMEDNSDRTRSQKTLCNRDPVGNLGCLGDRLDFDFPNGMAIFPSTPVTNISLGDFTNPNPVMNQGFSLFPFGYDVHGAVPNPTDMRTVNQDFSPVYEADDTLVTLTLMQALGDSHELEVSIARHETSFFSRTDWDATVGAPIIGVPLAGFGIPVLTPLFAPTTYGALFSGNTLPISNISTSNLGVLGLDILNSTTNYYTYDQSNTDGEQTTFEIILTSDFEGPWNYLLGGMYYDYEGSTDYNVAANTFDYLSTMASIASFASDNPLVPPPSPVDGTGVATPFFVNETDLYGLKTTGIFGELYFDVSDRVKLTLGLRHTSDEKRVRDRNLLVNTLLAPPPVFTPIGSTTANGLPDYEMEKADFTFTTGRFVVDWQFSDSTMMYGSLSRGAKGGGINPPFDPVQFPNASRTFDPEEINAFEIGTKSTFADIGLTLNLSAFYYDYEGLQIARIVQRTSLNENIDAEVTGFEAEFAWSPTDNFLINGTLSFLDTEIGNVAVGDPRDPSGGVSDSTIVKNLRDSENCVILWNGSSDPAGLPPLPPPFDPLNPLIQLLPFSSCPDLQASMPTINLVYGTTYSYTDSVEVNLDGNPLAGSPDTSFSLGAQYTFRIGDSLELTPRIDYYWQDDSQARIYNSPIDRIESWDNINAQITLAPDTYRWYFKVFVQNLNDDDNITGQFLNSAALGLSTNVFLMEPRRYGATFGINFD
ncbi:MAG: TonB-dependent receptor [Gammaproteobacteria bacterium]|nr:TonB-dependent receptor [Gammaproteobacteria bacterium]